MAVVGAAASLPRELVDIILSYLDDDIQALKSCRLASLTWPIMQTSATTYLFKSVDVSTTKRGRSIEAFLKLVASAPHIATSIRQLRLEGPTECATPKRTIDASLVSRLLQALPNLESLVLDCLEYGRSYGWPAASSRYRLKELVLNCYMITRNAYKTCLEIMSLFSEIDGLEVHSYATDYASPLPAITLPNPPPTIHSVALEEAKHQMLPFLRNALQISPDSVYLLSRRCISQESIDGLGEMIAEYGGHLKTLDIDVADLDLDVTTALCCARIAANIRAVRSLVLSVDESVSTWAAAFNILEAMPNIVKDITVVYSIGLHDPSWSIGITELGLRQLDHPLRRFTQLQSVEMYWKGFGRRSDEDTLPVADMQSWRCWYPEEVACIRNVFKDSPVQQKLYFEMD